MDEVVCHAGMMFSKGQELCVRGILENNEQNKQVCKTRISTVSPSEQLVRTGNNEYVIYSETTELTYRCPGVNPTTDQLEEGLYIIKLDQECVVNLESNNIIQEILYCLFLGFQNKVLRTLDTLCAGVERTNQLIQVMLKSKLVGAEEIVDDLLEQPLETVTQLTDLCEKLVSIIVN